VQTCSICNAVSPDEAKACSNCGADLSEFSNTATARKRFLSNPRVNLIRFIVMDDACPACQELEGTYQKTTMPVLPVKACSHENGCRCFYIPYLEEIYP
jgi:hypothetical protein